MPDPWWHTPSNNLPVVYRYLFVRSRQEPLAIGLVGDDTTLQYGSSFHTRLANLSPTSYCRWIESRLVYHKQGEEEGAGGIGCNGSSLIALGAR